MPFMLEGFKTAQRARIGYRKLFGAILIAVVAGTTAAFWTELHAYYKLGGAAKVSWVAPIYGLEPCARLEGWLKGTAPPTGYAAYAVGIGFAFTVILNALRMRLPWFPFHPVGYAISSSWSLHQLWICMFIAWAVKLLLLRYGGLRLYRIAMPFFLGLVLGECIMGSVWAIIGMIFNVPTYTFWGM